MQYAIVLAVPRTPAWEPWRAGLIVLAYAPLALWVWFNRRWVGVLILGLGLALNLAVMAANGGMMPIEPSTINHAGLGWQLATTSLGHALPHSKDVLLSPGSIRLAPLRDWIVLGGPPLVGRVLSPGDLVLFAGAFVTLAEVIRSLLVQPGATRRDVSSVAS